MFVYFAAEGDTDAPVAERLIRQVGLIPQRVIVAGGAPKLEQRILGLPSLPTCASVSGELSWTGHGRRSFAPRPTAAARCVGTAARGTADAAAGGLGRFGEVRGKRRRNWPRARRRRFGCGGTEIPPGEHAFAQLTVPEVL